MNIQILVGVLLKMFEDYLSGAKSLALFLLLKDEINILRKKLKLPVYSDEGFKEMFREKGWLEVDIDEIISSDSY